MFVGPVSTWLQANGWANAQNSPVQQVIAEQASAHASLAGAHSDYFLGTAGLAAIAAARRLQAKKQPEPVSLQTLIRATGTIIDKLA